MMKPLILVLLLATVATAQTPTPEDLAELASRAAKRAALDNQRAMTAQQDALLSEYLATLANKAAQDAARPVPTPVPTPVPVPVPTPVPVPVPAVATLTANPSALFAGQSAVLTLVTPTLYYHNVFINGVRPILGVTSGTATTWTLVVSPQVTTTYQAVATNSEGIPYVMPSAVVRVVP